MEYNFWYFYKAVVEKIKVTKAIFEIDKSHTSL